jgi:hypothetical protein
MDLAEIRKYLSVGSARSVCIDCREHPNYAGYVREIRVIADTEILFEINVAGYDEGGLSIKMTYRDTDEMVHSLEGYLGKGISQWENFSKTGRYPAVETTEDEFQKATRRLKLDLVAGEVLLPFNAISTEMGSGYWKNVAQGNAT